MAASTHIKPILLLSLLAFITILISPVSAENVTITFSTIDFDTNQEILIYNSAGEFIGEYSTEDTFGINSSYSYLFVFRPTSQTWFENPINTIEFLGIQLPVFMSYLIWGVVILCLLILVANFSGGKRRK